MNTIDEMLIAPAEVVLPPVVRGWKARLAAADELAVEISKPDLVLGSTLTELIVHRFEAGQEQQPQQFEWDDELNTALINLGVRAVDLNNESERFALGLRAALRKIERRYGDGYLNAVLITLIDESDLSKSGDIAEVRKFISATSLERNSQSYSDCREQIASAIGCRAVELRDKLKYSDDKLRTIMSKALARYLDERFSVTRRRSLG
jgi:hypothetical protein